MKVYNTLSRQNEEVKPIADGQISLYTCGPTVYSYYHIGNLRNAVFNDTLRRVLQAEGYNVLHVMNITDVGHLTSDADEGDDKLEKGAKTEGKSVWEVADFYTEAFKRDVKDLNILEPNGYKHGKDSYARATDFIDQQIEMVKLLLEKGFAYQTEQAIYFDVTKLGDYGQLTRQKLSDKEVAARSDVITDPAKHHPQDFALWFFSIGHFEGHSMHWPSPWGDGFPGWHLECSAIIHATLSDPIDIHTGAVDLIGTHHTNEIAQTEAAYGHELAHYWVHNEYVLVDDQRMSKSSGNFYTLEDVKDKGYDPLALRLLYLQTHYRSQMNFTWESLDAAQSFLKRLQAFADLKHQSVADRNRQAPELYQKVLHSIKANLSDDMNTSATLAELSILAASSEETGIDKIALQEFLDQLDNLLGLGLSNRADLEPGSAELLSHRQAARDKGDWSESDKLRQLLATKGLEISDTPEGPIWRRT